MVRVRSVVLIASFLPLCWLWMMAAHESGHVAGAWWTGGTVTDVVLHPLKISRTDVQPNPSLLFVVWSGPVVGCLLPLAAYSAAAACHWSGAFLLRFFSGFCLVANGLYIGVGAFDHVGDAGDLQRHGSPAWLLWIFGLVTVVLGFALWHGQGRHFGFGTAPNSIELVSTLVVLLVLTVILMLVYGS